MQLINALRDHLAEHGVIAPRGAVHVKVLAAAIDEPEKKLPMLMRDIGRMYLGQIMVLSEKIVELEWTLRREALRDEKTSRLQTMLGIGPITAIAIETFTPAMPTFKRGRDFAARPGLVPIQHSTGGKQRLGRTSKMGQHDIRRLLIIGAMTVIRWVSRKGAPEGS